MVSMFFPGPRGPHGTLQSHEDLRNRWQRQRPRGEDGGGGAGARPKGCRWKRQARAIKTIYECTYVFTYIYIIIYI